MSAYYNEIDPFAAATLRELIADGLIAPGYVDERSIADVRPDDLAGFVQHHFFAGFGVWSAALRLAGWPDDKPVWTASCPCPPFSAAGPNFRCPECDTRSPVPNAVRTGAFDCIRCGHEWQADARHLFPELFRLIREYDPECVLGEQVASNDGRTWLDIVSASLEMLGYAVGATDTCAAGFGAPHIRQREYWLADAMLAERPERRTITGDRPATGGGCIVGLADARCGLLQHQQFHGDDGSASAAAEREAFERQWSGARDRDGSAVVRLADTNCGQRIGIADGEGCERDGAQARRLESHGGAATGGVVRIERPGPTNGLWRDVDWLGCTDGKWRPVEPGTFPLANAGAFRNRVAELRGAGNAINLAQAAGFIEAVIAHRSTSQVAA